MKKLIWIIVIIVFLNKINMVFGKTYCDGWDEGYRRGWCSQRVNCIFDTVVPVCPVPEVNLTTYKDGFDRGFEQALKDRK